MKSFSPAGMAAKGLFGYDRTTGIGAKTFGNPDGAIRGGGAYAAGGPNPNGPDQGGGGGGGGNQVIFQFLNTPTNSNGPYDQPTFTSMIAGVTTVPPVGPSNLGDFSPAQPQINGQDLVVAGSVGVGPIWYYTLCVPAVVAQDFFTEWDFDTVSDGPVALTSATASFNSQFTAVGFSIWAWEMPGTGFPSGFVQVNSNNTITWA